MLFKSILRSVEVSITKLVAMIETAPAVNAETLAASHSGTILKESTATEIRIEIAAIAAKGMHILVTSVCKGRSTS